MIAKRLGAAADGQADAVVRLASSVREVATQARHMSHGLNPVDLNVGGLATALSALAQRVGQSFGIACNFRWDEIAEVFDDTTATQLYRIAQEAINNSIRHGKARKIEIRLTAEAEMLTLTISDNGQGFTIPDVRLTHPHTADEVAAATNAGIGLATMRYRSNMIGGIFDIQSRLRRGTTVSVSVRARPKTDRLSKQRKPKLL
jgi:signal transduction histidine kinase